MKPTLSLYKKELRRRAPFSKVFNKNTTEILGLLRGEYSIKNPVDITYINEKIRTMAILLHDGQKEAAKQPARTSSRKNDHLRFVECMVLDHIKPLYLKVNEVMRRYEMDGCNSPNVAPDFYDEISSTFKDTDFIPQSRYLPDLHSDFSDVFLLPVTTTYTMNPEKAKGVIALMKPKIAKIVTNYEQSGNGDGMREDSDDDSNDDGEDDHFDLNKTKDGSNKAAFLGNSKYVCFCFMFHLNPNSNFLLSFYLFLFFWWNDSQYHRPSILVACPGRRGHAQVHIRDPSSQRWGIF